jgi:hypothetical protein
MTSTSRFVLGEVVYGALIHPGVAVSWGFLLQLLGLLLPKYVPDEDRLRQPSWVGVVHHADALETMLQQHVLEPLLQGRLVCAAVPKKHK